ncbi:MAG: hypothetical protein ACI86M_000303 [Saprospiraceae bacterium]|jgi:hypothetical protein
MKLRQLTILGILFLCISVSKSVAQSDSLTLAQTDISILTCRSGDELYSTFGHTAIRINNAQLDLDLVYNYGLFSFETPNFYVKFMRGQLPYLLGNTKMQYFLREYQADKRSIFEQVLILDNKRKKEIVGFLQDNIKPENRAYAYDFFYDNCATRVVDVYDIYGQPGKEINYLKEVEEKTFRDLLKENLKNLPWSEFGIDIVIGARADQLTNRRHQMFLPEYLMDNLANATVEYEGTTDELAKEPRLILDFEKDNESRKSYATPWPLFLMLLLMFITIAINLKSNKWSRIFNKVLLGVSGFLGIFLIFMWFGTNHGATRDNWNVLWLNPLILLVSTKLRGNTILKMVLTGCLVIAGLNCFVTFLPQFFHLAFLPIISSILIVLWKLD